MFQRLIPVLFMLALFGCSDSSQDSRTSSVSGDSKYSLVFFLDPNGGPCRMQDAILKKMSGDLADVVNLRYVQTTVPADRDVFYRFGIRALPTLLLADGSGTEIRRLTPGVKSAEEIRGLLQAIPGR